MCVVSAAYNALLKCCSVVNNISGMQQILQLMMEQNMISDEFSMLSLINGQLVNDNIQAARDIIGNFRTLGVIPSIKTYRLLFAACKRCAQPPYSHPCHSALN
jgi:pentatricopeptide repeat protein